MRAATVNSARAFCMKHMNPRPAVALMVACASLPGCANSSPQHSLAVRVNATAINAAVAPYIGTQVPGLSVAVGYHGRVIFAKGYSKADLASGIPMTAHGRLGIGSLSKEMTSGALLTLARDQLLSIDDKVNVPLPRYTYGNRMTLRQLSTMSSGLQGALTHQVVTKFLESSVRPAVTARSLRCMRS